MSTFMFLMFGEFVLRKYGFCHAPLYFASDEFEYMQKADQKGNRFGCKYYNNHYCQRSNEVDSTKKHILGLGDSVIHGGAACDQDSIATSLFTNETGIQMLNISAGSWGPDNCAAYLRHYGTFDSKAIFLVVSSHDAHDNMEFQPTVDVHLSFPSKQFRLAWAELTERYIWPKMKHIFKVTNHHNLDPDQKVLSESGINIDKKGKVFNTGFNDLKLISDSLNIPFTIYLHADIKECENNEYNEQGLEIIQWCTDNNVKLIKDLDEGVSIKDYRDGIHLNVSGQRRLANVMKREYQWLTTNLHN